MAAESSPPGARADASACRRRPLFRAKPLSDRPEELSPMQGEECGDVGRMRKRSEFLAARRGRRLNGPFFFLEVLDRQDGGAPRFGLTVTRKVGNAVVRNRIRRRLREAVRTACGADMKPGFDYVIVARREVLDLAFDRMTAELSRRLRGERAAKGHEKRPPRGVAGNG